MVASTRGFALAILIAGSPLAAAQTAAPQVEFDTPDQLQQLVAPIALYPDTLLAEVLAASTYPAEIADAEQFLQQNQNLSPADLAAAVNQQPWDSSVRALTQFPDVLANLSQNLSWTSALGDAYYNQPQDVIDAVQVLRHEAWNAGTLRSTSQQTVSFDGDTIVISPGSAEVVYVPTYNPWVCYGPPLPPFPGYIGYWPGPPGLRFVIVIHILPVFGRWNWGWHSWGFD